MTSTASRIALLSALLTMPAFAATSALETPLPPEYVEVYPDGGEPDATAQANAKDLTAKQYTVNTKGNGPLFAGGSCPSAGFLATKPWRARVTFEKTFHGTIVYTGTGQQCVTFGTGRVEYEDGSVYEGRVGWANIRGFSGLANFEPAIPSGAGKLTLPNGVIVEGSWVRGEPGGPMTVTMPGAQPQAGVVTTLAALRQGVAPAAGTSVAAVAAVGTAVAVDPAAAPGAAQPFAPAGSGGLPFTPAGAGAGAAAVAAAPGKAGPQPMLGNGGKYMCPWTEDGVVAPWVDKAIKARMGGAIGGMVGAEAGKKIFENVPMFGGMFGKAAGDKIGREAAIKMAGGWEYIRENTDQSFDNVHEYVAWMKANYKGTEHYDGVVAAIKELYPELKTMPF
jgi:hypothetical protein